MATSDDTRNITPSKVIVRPLERRDQTVANHLVWKLIYYQTAKKLAASELLNKRLLLVCTLTFILGYLYQYRVSQAFLCFISPPCIIYVFTMCVLLPFKYYGSRGNAEGLYDFWSQNDIGRRFWVADVDGAVVGTAAIERLSATTAEVFRVSVHREYQGLGIANKLMETLLHHCKTRGFDHVILLVSNAQCPAQSMYKKIGFVRVNSKKMVAFLLEYETYMYHFSHTRAAPGLWASKQGMKVIYS